MITIKQFNQSTVNPVDDATLYYMLMQSSGVLSGLQVTLSGTNQLNVTAGYAFACGRMLEVSAETVSASLATSGTQKGRLYIHIDLTNATTPAQLMTVAAATLPDPEQDNLNAGGSLFDIPLAEYDVTVAQVTGLSYVAPRCTTAPESANLLINANFLLPVNQRGKTQYTTSDSYTIDRWRLVSGSVSIGTDGLTVTGAVVQPVEGLASMEGHPFTLSAKKAGGGVQAISGTLSSTPVQATSGYTMSFSISGDNVLVSLGAGTWEWAKLEMGEYPSAFSPRTYADEVLLCHRYTIRYTNGIFQASGYWNQSIQTQVFFPVPMRTKPTAHFDLTHGSYIGTQNGNQGTSFSIVTASAGVGDENQITIDIASNATFTSKNYNFLIYGDGDYLELDAEIY